MTKRYFVKFVPCTAQVIAGLINKTIKFSTVYEFNDFNELRYLAPLPKSIIDNPKLNEFVSTELKSAKLRANLIENSKKCGRYNKEFINDLEKLLDTYVSDADIIDEVLQFLLENIAYSKVGILCLSSIEVFKNDAAQLMFAHYADNLKGLAIVYELNSNCGRNIEYKNQPIICDLNNRPIDWADAVFTNVQDFIFKSPSWNYEKEFRIFHKPGIVKIKDIGIKLKAIFHTPRIDEKLREMLYKIIEEHYKNEDKIEIKELTHNITHDNKCEVEAYFKIGGIKAYDWIENNLINKKSEE